jgi:Undecaprenyl-phosphate galactose phosphotransferase WbaP
LLEDGAGPHRVVEPQRFTNHTLGRSKRYLAQVLLTSTPLVIADLLALIGSLLLAVMSPGWLNLATNSALLHLIPFLAAILLFVYFMFGLYPGSGLSPIFELRQTTVATTLVFFGFLAATLPMNKMHPHFILVVAWLLTIAAAPIMRFLFRRIFSNFQWWGHPVLLFGGEKAKSNYDYLFSRPHFGLRPVGIVGDSRSYPYLGTFEMAPSIAKDNRIYWAVVALPEQSSSDVLRVIKKYVKHIPHVLFVTDYNEMPSLWNRFFDFGRLNGICIKHNLLLPLPRITKRLADLVFTSMVGLCCLPLVGVIFLLIKTTSPGPAFYGHERIGYRGRRFKAWKFRTMVVNGDIVLNQYLESNPELREEWEKNQKLRNDPRVTKIGAWLRKMSLDELPQLWNILVGEMSLVGPRPIVEAEIVRYGESFDLYTRVVPGLTGLWQVSGRNNTTYDERVSLDSYYVRNWSPWMDIYILARTVKVVLFFDGAY